jgi:hypothetical protein
MTGVIKLTTSIATLLVAGLATLLVFDVIPSDVFSAGVKKILLVAIIFGLTAGVLAFISRLGK